MSDVTGMQSAGRVLSIYQGDYDNEKMYEHTDIVLYNGSSYIALKDTVGNEPPEPSVRRNEFWQLVAKGITDTSTSTVEFTQATTRTNIASGETNSTLFGKISKWFSDLKPHAFNALTNNLLATVEGVSGLDAVQGNVLDGKIEEKDNEIKKVYPYNGLNNVVDYFGLDVSNGYSSMLDFVNALPINIDIKFTMNTDSFTIFNEIVPSKYGIINVKKGWNNGYYSVEFYDTIYGEKFLYTKGNWKRIATSHDIDAINGDLGIRVKSKSGRLTPENIAIINLKASHNYFVAIESGIYFVFSYSASLRIKTIVSSENIIIPYKTTPTSEGGDGLNLKIQLINDVYKYMSVVDLGSNLGYDFSANITDM